MSVDVHKPFLSEVGDGGGGGVLLWSHARVFSSPARQPLLNFEISGGGGGGGVSHEILKGDRKILPHNPTCVYCYIAVYENFKR